MPAWEKPITCQRGHKMHLNLCFQNSINEHAKCISTCDEESKHVLAIQSHASTDRKSIATCVGQTKPIPASTQNVSQLVLNKSIPSQLAHKMHLNSCWSNTSHARERIKWIWTCVDQTPARTRNASLYVLTKPIQCQWVHKHYLNMCSDVPWWQKIYLPFQHIQNFHRNICWPNPSYTR